jgi:aryl-alcohol dehydrogenase
VSLVGQGRLPIGRLITEYAFEDIGWAAQDMTTTRAIKPVLRL